MTRLYPYRKLVLAISLLLLTVTPLYAQDDVTQKLQGFDAFMEKTLKDWNAPGIGVGIVVNDKLVFVKGYGYRDYEKKLPITAQTMFPIANKPLKFRVEEFADVVVEFVEENGQITAIKQIDPSGEYVSKRK